ncbi:MAG TPA: dockerin type I domain-containing protein [bacterium]|nr:dockerin type I domain-containing protein [bacterium]
MGIGALVLFCLALALPSAAHAATLTTDRADYPPGDTVWITGAGYGYSAVSPTGGETVEFYVRHVDKSGALTGEYGPWTAAANAKGAVSTFWVVPYNDSIVGATLELTGTGLSSGLIASTMFTDANVVLDITTVVPDTICPGDTTRPGRDSLYLCARLLQGSCNLPLPNRPIRFYWNPGNCGVDSDAEGEDTVWTDANGYACTDLPVPDESGNWVLRVKFEGEDKPSPCPTPGNSACDPNDPNSSKRCVNLSASNICKPVVIDTVVCCQPPVCSLLVNPTPPACLNGPHIVPFVSIDPQGGSTTCTLYGPGQLINGAWTYTPTGGETVNVRIVCKVACGDSCVIAFSATYPTRVPPVCNVPDDTTIQQCDPTQVSLPVSATGGTCAITSGPGTLANGFWTYTPSGDEVVTVTVACASPDFCDTCTASFSVTFDINDPPRITCPDNKIFDCDNIGSFGTPTVADDRDANPSVYIVSRDSIAGNCDYAYTLRLRYVVKDACGDSAYCDQSITVQDTARPEIVCPAPLTFECDSVPADADLPKPTVTDNCDTNVALQAFPASSTTIECPQGYHKTILWVATDDCGNVDSCTQVINVVDTTPPVLVGCRTLITIACDSFYTKSIESGLSPVLPTAEDNCDDSVAVQYRYIRSGGTWPCNYYDSVAIWAVDDCGNVSDTCYQRLELVDTTAPEFDCPDSTLLECGVIDFPAPPTATDNCSQPTIKLIGERHEDSTCYGAYRIVLTWEAMDACGLADTCEQVIRYRDSAKPTFVECEPLRYECDEVPSVFSPPVATDVCDPSVEVTLVDQADTVVGGCPQRYSFNLYWQAIDDCGNADTCIQTVYVTDTTPPVMTCPPDTALSCDELPLTKAGSWVAGSGIKGDEPNPWPFGIPGAKDNCDDSPEIYGTILSLDGAFPCNLYLIVGYYSVDSCGNVSDTCRQTVIVRDTTPPVVTCPPDTTVECDELTDALRNATVGQTISVPGLIWPYGAPSGTDNCSDTVFIVGPFVSRWIDQNPCHIQYELAYIGYDLCQNADTCYQILTIVDTTDPVIACPEQDTVPCSQIPTGWNPPPATDNCDPQVSVTQLGELRWGYADCPIPDTIIVTWVAVDDCNNADTCEQVIIVIDTVPPVLTCEPLRYECDEIPAEWPTPLAVDNCNAQSTVTLLGVSDTTYGDCPQRYTFTLYWEARDNCGNADTCHQQVFVIDTTAPTITCPPDTVVDCAELAGPAGGKALLDGIASGAAGKDANGCYDYDWRYGKPVATDNCDDTLFYCLYGVRRLSVDTCRAVFELQFTAIDDCGNSDTCSQRVTFVDTTAPVLVCAPDTTVYCAGDGGLDCWAGKSGPQKLSEKYICEYRLIDTLYDACDPEIDYYAHFSVHFEKCPQYVRAKLWAVDDCGNISDTCFWTVWFVDTVAPVITCPKDIRLECGTDPGDLGMATATDDCDGQVTATLVSVDTVAQQGNCYIEIARTFAAVDICGNRSTCTQTIIVGDSTAPVITCPPDTTVTCEELDQREGKAALASLAALPAKSLSGEEPCLTGYDYRYGRPSATDNCSEYNICLYDVDLLDTNPCHVVFELKFAAIDACGNVDTCAQRVTFVDETAPVLVCAPDTTIYCARDKADCIQLKGTDPFRLDKSNFLCGFRMVDTVYDGCCDSVEVLARLTYHLNKCPAYIKAFIWAVDCCGNVSDTCTWILNIADTTAPVVTCPNNLYYECDDKQGDWGWPSATDNCDDAVEVVLLSQDTTAEGCAMIIARTFAARDRCENEGRCVQTITIADTTAPVCRLPVADTFFLCHPDTTICLPVSATDNCDESVTCTVVQGAGQIIDGRWCYTPTAVGGPVSSVIRCVDDCGNACSGQIDFLFIMNAPPECRVPDDTTIYLCDPATITLPLSASDSNGNFSHCAIKEGPGTLTAGAQHGTYEWSYGATKDETICVTVECVDSCGAYCVDRFCVTINVTEPPQCYQTPDTTVALCNPEPICVRVDWPDPAVSSRTSDVVRTTKGGARRVTQPTPQLPGSQGNTGSSNKGALAGCNILAGPGTLDGDFWCWTPPDYDTSVTVLIQCADTCGHTCQNEFTVNFDMNVNPTCSIFVELVDPICTPDTDFVPLGSFDVDGETRCRLIGPGQLVPGGWQYPNPAPGTSAQVTIVCADTCGDSCVIDFTRNYPQRVPVECQVPGNIDTLLCGPTTLSFPVSGGVGATCQLVAGPGQIVNGQWSYNATTDANFTVTVRCLSLCDSCQASFNVSIEMNDPPSCVLPADTSYFLCAPQRICRTVSAIDPNGNLMSCALGVGAPGTLVNGEWCYDVTGDGQLTVPIVCTDSCGATCSGSFTVSFDVNSPPTIDLGPDQSLLVTTPPTLVCFTYTVGDPDGPGGLIESLVSGPTGTTINTATNQVCWSANAAGVFEFVVRVDDPCGASDVDTAYAQVGNPQPPVCMLPGDTALSSCGTSEIALPVTAVGANPPFSCAVIAGPGTVSGGFWRWTPTADGTYEIVIRCTSAANASCDGSFRITVDVNQPPVCSAPPTAMWCLCPNQPATMTMQATDPDNNIVKYEMISGPGSFSGNVWTYYPPNEDELMVRWRVIDACGAADTCQTTLQIDFNDPPILTVRDDTTVTLCDPSQPFCRLLNIFDQNNNVTSVVVTSGYGTVQQQGNQWYWCFTPPADGKYSATVRVTDACGQTSTRTFTVTFILIDPPACNLPPSGTYLFCQSPVCIPIAGNNPPPQRGVTCQIIDGPGYISNGNWCVNITQRTTFNIVIRCVNSCGGNCQISRTYTFEVDPRDCDGGQAGVGPDGQPVVTGMQAGDVDASGEINIADLALLTHIVSQISGKATGAALNVGSASAGYSSNADVNCDGAINRRDIADLTAYLFNSGPQPCTTK